MIWLTSDHHFGHGNIIEYSNRPYDGVEEMNEELISNHNAVVSVKDTVYHLGDFTFRDAEYAKGIMERMNGIFTVIRGNHDYWTRKLKLTIKNLHEICDYKELKHNKENFILFHYPIERWRNSHHGVIHFHGHSHGECPHRELRRMDVGVDPNYYVPVLLSKGLIESINERRVTPHHEAETDNS